ncbi:MAG TPA: hypothetical protein VJ891_05755 [Casimicrobiaceae bacterium]|nr:hypothetical protein [Casimicrobiaceae bacterium]
MEKCVACQYYERNDAQVEEKGIRWGKCRRGLPVVHPVNAKAYMVEGVWPHVRDDDWCGEWTARRSQNGVSVDPRSSLMQASTASVRAINLPPGSLMTPPAVGSAPIAMGTASSASPATPPISLGVADDLPISLVERFGSD